MTPQITTLENGLRIVSYEMPALQTTTLGMFLKTGTRNETVEQNGIAHLLEHMAFKGTSRRSAYQIAKEIEDVGGEINAATSMEVTAYYARILKDHVPLSVDILSDIILDPKFDPEELEREREVVLQEIAATNDSPDDIVFDLAQKAAFPEDPLGRPILGTAEAVKAYTGDEIAAYRDSHYAAPSMVVSAAGAVDHEHLVELSESALSGMRRQEGPGWQKASYAGGDRRERKPLEQTYLVLSFSGPGYRHEDIYAIQMLSGILGGGMSSRLFQEAREKRGLCYSIFAYTSPYQDTGLVSVYAATGPELADELVDVVCDELCGLVDDVSDDEVNRAQAQLKAGLMMSLESPSARAGQIARQLLLYDRIVDPEEIIAKVDAVDASTVKRMAREMFSGARPAVGAVGELSGLACYDRIAAKFA